jgi:hypothetical protein
VIGWWATRVRQFVRHLSGRVSRTERLELERWLRPAQLELFDTMHRADQRHGLDVVRALRARRLDDADLLLAGLLHDCAKGRRVGVWHRVAWALGERHGDWVLDIGRRLPGFGTAFELIEDHAARSADLALAAGCSPRTAQLIRQQAEPTDDRLGEALRLADQAN